MKIDKLSKTTLSSTLSISQDSTDSKATTSGATQRATAANNAHWFVGLQLHMAALKATPLQRLCTECSPPPFKTWAAHKIDLQLEFDLAPQASIIRPVEKMQAPQDEAFTHDFDLVDEDGNAQNGDDSWSTYFSNSLYQALNAYNK